MRRLRTSDASTTSAIAIKSGTWDFLQDSHKELFAALLRSKIGDGYLSTDVYIIYGCRKSSSGGSTSITEGAVYYNGEVYLSPAQTFADPAGSDVIVADLETTQFSGSPNGIGGTTADPVTFTDGAIHNIHDIRQVKYKVAASGTGNLTGGNIKSDFSNFKNSGEWTNAGTPTIVNYDTGATSVNSTAYNKYRLEGLTLFWSIQFTFTITGGVGLFGIRIPSSISSLYKFKGVRTFYGKIYNSTGSSLLDGIRQIGQPAVWVNGTETDTDVIYIYPPIGGVNPPGIFSFGSGGFYLDLVAELEYK